MAPSFLTDFKLSIDIESFVALFWFDSRWYETFLQEQMEDLNVQVGDWGTLQGQMGTRVRDTCSLHPLKISFPGMPSHAESHATQAIELFEENKQWKLVIKETSSSHGVPYSDYFNIVTEWTVLSDRYDDNGSSQCTVTIMLDIVFHKSTWLKGTIESNSKAELLRMYELWKEKAEDSILSHKPVALGSVVSIFRGESDLDSTLRAPTAADTTQPSPSYVSTGDLSAILKTGNLEAHSRDSTADEYDIGSQYSRGSSRNAVNQLYSSDVDGEGDDDLQFFDCEEGDMERDPLMLHHVKYQQLTLGNVTPPRGLGRGRDGMGHPFVGMGSTESLHRWQNGAGMYPPGAHPGGQRYGAGSAHDVAVSIVETIFVICEFWFWRVHNIYSMDLKTLFNVEPAEVLNRVANSLLPGWHSPALTEPDIYGPLIAVFSLPQVLLMSLEVYDSDSSCSQPSLLGNSVVVSLCLWMGLSCLYRLLAFMIAPGIEFKHCLCMTGYSFFGWSIALLLSYPLEMYEDLIGLPVTLPLVVFGLPSSIAQGCMFWEHTTASSATIQPPTLPTSCHRCAYAQTRYMQRLIWAVPKIIAFVVVTATHYQFLWYVVRVFFPGKKQLCRLSSMMQPAQYADIITQKQLRDFATDLITGDKRR